MNFSIISEARSILSVKPLTLEELHEKLCQAGSQWNREQHQLFFLACAGFVVEEQDSGIFIRTGEQSKEDLLLAEIIKIAESFSGKPVPSKEIRLRLPGHFVTTDEQIKALARKSERLSVVGPGLVKIADK